MPKGFTVNAHRWDPYKNFKFQISWNDRTVLGVSKITALKRTIEVVKHRAGGDVSSDSKSCGRTTYEPITLERGVTHDREFEAWANKVHPYSGDPDMDLKYYKKDLKLNILNERGQISLSFNIYGAWPSEFQASSDLDANANAVLIESLKLEMEGWERDVSVSEPDETAKVPMTN